MEISDAAALADWQPKFKSWVEDSLPLFKEGKAKQAFGSYPWFTTDDTPFVRLDKPVREARFGLITTGGYSIEGVQKPFQPGPSFDGAVPGIRSIPLDVDRSELRIDHFGYDHRFAKEDINVNLPLDRMRELAEAGEIGSVARETQVVMGLQPNVEPLIRETIPTLIDALHADDINAVLLVPS
jgi:D-proline reductase (dithiol) PrdB